MTSTHGLARHAASVPFVSATHLPLRLSVDPCAYGPVAASARAQHFCWHALCPCLRVLEHGMSVRRETTDGVFPLTAHRATATVTLKRASSCVYLVFPGSTDLCSAWLGRADDVERGVYGHWAL